MKEQSVVFEAAVLREKIGDGVEDRRWRSEDLGCRVWEDCEVVERERQVLRGTELGMETPTWRGTFQVAAT